MSFQPFLLAIFCDDVRMEAGNKVSYMGVYGPNLIVHSLPTTLLKLCCVFHLRIPATMKPQHVVLRLLRDDQPIFEMQVAPPVTNEAAERLADEAVGTHVIALNHVLPLVNLQIHSERRNAQAIVDGKEIRGGGLELMAADEASLKSASLQPPGQFAAGVVCTSSRVAGPPQACGLSFTQFQQQPGGVPCHPNSGAGSRPRCHRHRQRRGAGGEWQGVGEMPLDYRAYVQDFNSGDDRGLIEKYFAADTQIISGSGVRTATRR